MILNKDGNSYYLAGPFPGRVLYLELFHLFPHMTSFQPDMSKTVEFR